MLTKKSYQNLPSKKLSKSPKSQTHDRALKVIGNCHKSAHFQKLFSMKPIFISTVAQVCNATKVSNDKRSLDYCAETNNPADAISQKENN